MGDAWKTQYHVCHSSFFFFSFCHILSYLSLTLVTMLMTDGDSEISLLQKALSQILAKNLQGYTLAY